MPQLVPFYWMNLLTTGIAAVSILLYLSATIILPNVLRLLVARAIIVRVSVNNLYIAHPVSKIPGGPYLTTMSGLS